MFKKAVVRTMHKDIDEEYDKMCSAESFAKSSGGIPSVQSSQKPTAEKMFKEAITQKMHRGIDEE